MHDCRLGGRLAQLLDADDLDAAIGAGLMAFAPCPACDAAAAAKIVDARARLAKAWAARERYRARQARLARIAAERAAPPQAQKASQQPQAGQSALPPAAAAALARARAKAAQRGEQ